MDLLTKYLASFGSVSEVIPSSGGQRWCTSCSEMIDSVVDGISGAG